MGVDDSGRIRRVVLDMATSVFRSRRQAIIARAGVDSLRRIEMKMAREDFDRVRVLREALVEDHACRHPVRLTREGGTLLFSFTGPTPDLSGSASFGPEGVRAVLGGHEVEPATVRDLLGIGHGPGASRLAKSLARALAESFDLHGVHDGCVSGRCLDLERGRLERGGLEEFRQAHVASATSQGGGPCPT